MRVVWTRFP